MEKRLYKSMNDRVIDGVCGGIAEYFTIDPVIIRLLVVFFTLFGGAGLVFYIVAAIVMKKPPIDIETGTYSNAGPQSDQNSESYTADQSEYADQAEQTYQTNPSSSTSTPNRSRNTGLVLLGLILIGMGGLYILRWFFPWFSSGLVVAGIAIVIGLVLILRK